MKSPRGRLTRPGISHAPAFGRWIAQRRGRQSLEQIALKIRPYVESTGLKVDRSSLAKVEAGRLPSWPMLAALAIVFEVPMREMVDRLVSSIEFPGAEKLLPRGDGWSTTSSAPREEADGNWPTPASRLLQSRLIQSEAARHAM